jgi:hypothetical protein
MLPGSWQYRPELPKHVFSSQMVEDPLGGVILIGGYVRKQGAIANLYRLSHSGVGAKWTRLPQKLSRDNYEHVAMLIPDRIANCTAP